jgi:hypothetical protein
MIFYDKAPLCVTANNHTSVKPKIAFLASQNEELSRFRCSLTVRPYRVFSTYFLVFLALFDAICHLIFSFCLAATPNIPLESVHKVLHAADIHCQLRARFKRHYT